MNTISSTMTDFAIAEELYARLERRRKNMGFTQEEMAERVGITPKSYRAIPKGTGRLTSFIALLRYLDCLDNLNLLVSEPTISPLAMLEQERKKSTSRRNKATLQASPPLHPQHQIQHVASNVSAYEVTPSAPPAHSSLRSRRQKFIVKG